MSYTSGNQRRKETRWARIEAQRRLDEQRRRRNRVGIATVVVVGLILVGFGVTQLAGAVLPGGGVPGGGDLSQFGDLAASSETTTATTVFTENTGFAYGSGECPTNAKPLDPKRSFYDAPQKCIDDETTDYGAVVHTSEGDFTIDLNENGTPGTVNNFVVLAKYGFYDGLSFHRVAEDFVVQTGDPDPDDAEVEDAGYYIADELPDYVSDYVEGSVAMANSGTDTNGSQWFVWTGPTQLTSASYSLFGKVTDGLEVVKDITALAPSSGDGAPTREVTVTSIDITEKAKASTSTTSTSTTSTTSTTTTTTNGG